MTQKDFSYLLNLSEYPALTSPWRNSNTKPALNPAHLGRIANQYLRSQGISWTKENCHVNGESFRTSFFNLLEKETNIKALSEFLILKWFTNATIEDIDENMRSQWAIWKDQKLSKLNKYEANLQLLKNKDAVYDFLTEMKDLENKPISDAEYGKEVKTRWQGLKAIINDFIVSKPATIDVLPS